jgi:hypothetical protein
VSQLEFHAVLTTVLAMKRMSNEQHSTASPASVISQPSNGLGSRVQKDSSAAAFAAAILTTRGNCRHLSELWENVVTQGSNTRR